MANQFLGLSLFIMLLSFFIVLNSLSDFEEKKASPVLNSLSVAFSLDEPKEESADEETQPTEEMRKGTTLDKLQGHFEAHISGVKPKQNRLGTVMHLRLPYAEFEQEISKGLLSGGQVSREGFIQTLVSLMDTQKSGEAYKMHMVVNLETTPAQALGNSDPDLGKRIKEISGVANILEKAGLPKKLVTTGLKSGNKGMIDLYFLRYEPFNPFVGVNTEGVL